MAKNRDDSPSGRSGHRSKRLDFVDRYLQRNDRSRLTALLVGQVDAFNRIATTFGDERTNAFFTEYSETIRGALPEGSVVVRLSERRFAALIPIDAMGGLIDLVSHLTEQYTPRLVVGNNSLLVDVTIGAAVYPTHATGAASLFRRAELALTEARRNELMFELYRPDATQQQQALWKFSSDLEEAIQNGELEVYMQPKVRPGDGTAAGAEALVRWRQKSGQVILPSEFIPLAENSGSIVALTWLVFDRIEEATEKWSLYIEDFTVAVNVSAKVMDHVDFLSRVESLKKHLDERGLRLLIELTEESLVEDFKKIRKKADRLRELGVGLAIDDFGKGYSSLTYLKDIPATEIKIDKKFVGQISVDEKDWHIVRAMMDLAQAFGMRVVAEGVDNDASMKVLAELGVELVQGFYISRPMRADIFEDWLRANRDNSGIAIESGEFPLHLSV